MQQANTPDENNTLKTKIKEDGTEEDLDGGILCNNSTNLILISIALYNIKFLIGTILEDIGLQVTN